MTLLEASNYHQTRRHYAEALAPVQPGGNAGQALCSSPNLPTEVFDQEHQEKTARFWGTEVKEITGLPLCQHCERKAKKLGLEVPQ